MNTSTSPRLAYDMKPVKSSQIHSIGHDAATNTLAIRFPAKGRKPGALYQYSNISGEEFAAFAAAPSIGSHFYKHIKSAPDRYPYERIIEQDPTDIAGAALD